MKNKNESFFSVLNKITVIPIVFGMISPVYAETFCEKVKEEAKEPKINFIADYGKAHYQDIRRNLLIEKSGQDHTRGLTEADFNITYQIKTNAVNNGKQGCLFIEEIDVKYGYPNLVVYIEDKYHPNSCEYREILKHENEHVKVHQSVLKELAPKISLAVYQAVNRVKPKELNDLSKVDKITDDIIKEIQDDFLVKRLTERLEENQRNQNEKLDEKGNYHKIQNRCKNW